jgi:hypothetical protein
MTQGRLWIRFALPGVVESLIERGVISGLAKPGALLEQIWNTLLEIGVPGFPIPSSHCHLRNFCRAHHADNPSNPSAKPFKDFWR